MQSVPERIDFDENIGGKKMAEKRNCELCGQQKANLSNNHGLLVCSSCAVIQSGSKNRPEVVIESLRVFHHIHSLLTDEEKQKIAADFGAGEHAETIEALKTELVEEKAAFEKIKLKAIEMENLVTNFQAEAKISEKKLQEIAAEKDAIKNELELTQELLEQSHKRIDELEEAATPSSKLLNVALDLALGSIDGSVKGVLCDQIQAIREAA
ncbi:hypothetical protein [Desulforhopalus singaporensis]|nr:hypothetical protein [Desulforhopalus singaporensis]